MLYLSLFAINSFAIITIILRLYLWSITKHVTVCQLGSSVKQEAGAWR